MCNVKLLSGSNKFKAKPCFVSLKYTVESKIVPKEVSMYLKLLILSNVVISSIVITNLDDEVNIEMSHTINYCDGMFISLVNLDLLKFSDRIELCAIC